MSKADFKTLLQRIFENGCYSKAGRDATEELVAGGESSLDMFLSVDCYPQSTLHPRDLVELASDLFDEFAKR